MTEHIFVFPEYDDSGPLLTSKLVRKCIKCDYDNINFGKEINTCEEYIDLVKMQKVLE